MESAIYLFVFYAAGINSPTNNLLLKDFIRLRNQNGGETK